MKRKSVYLLNNLNEEHFGEVPRPTLLWWDPDAWKNCSATNLTTACTAKVLIEGKMNY